MSKILLEARYLLLKVDGWQDEHIINQLDMWLEDWLYRKSVCPVCGAIEMKNKKKL